MQIHKLAEERFSPEAVNNFWNIITHINWNEESSTQIVKTELMKLLTPNTAEQMRRICFFYAYALTGAYVDYCKSVEEEYNTREVECASSNVISGGKYHYDEYLANPRYMKTDIDNISLTDNVLLSIPSEDDYYAM